MTALENSVSGIFILRGLDCSFLIYPLNRFIFTTVQDPYDLQRELKVKLSKEMDEFLLKIKEGWKSEIGMLNRPSSNMTVLNGLTWVFVKDHLRVQLRTAVEELKKKGQEQIKETLAKSSKILSNCKFQNSFTFSE